MKRDPYLILPKQKLKIDGVKLPLEYLFRGLLVIGAPGCGKTRGILMPLVDEIFRTTGTSHETKVGLMIADPKNEFKLFLQESLKRVGRSDDLIILGPGEGCYNPLSSPFLTETETVEKIISLAGNRNRSLGKQRQNDEMFWENSMRSLLSVCIQISLQLNSSPLTFSQINDTLQKIESLKTVTNANEWLKKSQIELTPDVLHSLTVYLSLPSESTRACVTSQVSGVLDFWQREPLKSLTNPTKGINQIDPISVINEGKILLISCSSAAFGVSMTPLLLALKEELFSALLSRDQIDVESEGSRSLLNQERPVFIVADEFQSYLSADSNAGELAALDRLRGFRGGYIAASQNLASLHSVLAKESDACRLIGLFANQVYMSNICPITADFAQFLFSDPESDDLPPPLLPGVEKTDFPAKLSEPFKGSMLARAQTGEYWIRCANGDVFRRKTKIKFH